MVIPAALLAGFVGGCNVLGLVGASLPPPTIPAAYTDLAEKTAGVTVWAPTQVRADFSQVNLDLGQAVQARLEQARDKGTRGQKNQLEGLEFTFPAASYVRMIVKNPAMVDRPIVEIAPDIGVQRVIVIELDEFTNRSGVSGGLVRGRATFGVKVIEVDDAGNATEAFSDAGFTATFPQRGLSAGSTTLTPQQAYQGLVLEVSKIVAEQFMPHTEED